MKTKLKISLKDILIIFIGCIIGIVSIYITCNILNKPVDILYPISVMCIFSVLVTIETIGINSLNKSK